MTCQHCQSSGWSWDLVKTKRTDKNGNIRYLWKLSWGPCSYCDTKRKTY